MNLKVMRVLVKRTVGARGQVVLPIDIREQLGLREGTEITFEAKQGEIVIKPAKTPQEIVEEFCNSSRRIKIKGDPIKWFKKRLDEQYEEKYRGILRR
ncbi:AbrB/MazE/SpoVT family DNA-binding domain-containing protein [Candidatus Woesearchaeota archaeon]|nr:AbrB/MazE/SpoVT family DNA-binding domain-containing protein [Candidatus Woesearchaeota archaeon]